MRTFVALVAGVCVAGSAVAMDVALTVQETAGVARVKAPCRSGIPLLPGAVKDEKKLRLLDDKGAEVPAQFRVINRRDAGDIEWVCLDFLADAPANGSSVYHLTDTGPPRPVERPVTVDDAADAIRVNVGPLALAVSKKSFTGLGQVLLAVNGGLEPASPGGALTIKGVDGRTYSSATDLTGPLDVTLEEQGPLHVVVRIDGQMRCMTADGNRHFYPTYDLQKKTYDREGVAIDNKDGSLGFTVRLHLWKDQPAVHAFVTMRNLDGHTADWTDAKIQFAQYYGQTARHPKNFVVDAINFDVSLPASPARSYAIGGGIDGTERLETHAGDLAEAKGAVVLYQDSSASWNWQAGTGRIWDERLRKNIEFMKRTWRETARAKGEDEEAAEAKAPPFYEYSPFIFHDLICKRDGGSFMGYRLWKGAPELVAGSHSGFNAAGVHAGEGMRAPGWIETSDGRCTVGAGCRWFWQMYPKSLELRPDKLTIGLWSQYLPRGHVFEGRIHRTHDLLFTFRPAARAGDGGAPHAAFSQRLIATPTPRHNLACGAYGDFMLPSPQEWPRYEKSALAAVQPWLDETLNPGFASGIEIEREKGEHFDVWRFGDSQKNSWHSFGQYQELDVPYCLMVHYARTGDLRFYRAAEEAGRMLLDIPAHGGGYGHQKGEPSHYYVYGPLLFANVTAEPFLRDAIVHSHRIVNPKPWHLRSFAITMWSNWAMYFGFPESPDRAAWLAAMQADLDYWKANQKADGSMGGMDRASQPFFLGLASDAMGRYCESFPADKESRQALVRAMQEWMDHIESLPADARKKLTDDAMEKTCANGFAFATRFSGDPAFLEFAARNFVRDESFPTHYRNGVCSAKAYSETASAHRLIQVFMHDWDKRRHPEKYGDPP